MAAAKRQVARVVLVAAAVWLAATASLKAARPVAADASATLVRFSDGSGGVQVSSGTEVYRFSFENDDARPYDGDRDYDGFPDDWSRRRGPQYPHYVEISIDRTHAYHGRQSLHISLNGGRAAVYSPINDQVGRIDPRYLYVFRAYIRTQRLQHCAAVISVSFLNHRRERVQRFLTTPVSGTHSRWVCVTLGPMTPLPDVRFVVFGCHVVDDGKQDYRGDVWFDDLWLGRLPRLALQSNFAAHFRNTGQSIEITTTLSGLDPDEQYELRLQMEDAGGRVVAQKVIPYATRSVRSDEQSGEEDGRPSVTAAEQFREVWRLPPQPSGYYRVKATLMKGGSVVLTRQTSFAVLDLLTNRPAFGEFGWSIARSIDDLPLTELELVASEAGINWLKLPLWHTATMNAFQTTLQVSALLQSLGAARIEPVGVLNDPPKKLRQQFAENWRGVGEIFSMPPEFWSPYLEPVVARYSSSVRYWQLGDDADHSFRGTNRLARLLTQIKQEFDRIGRDTHIGVHWDWQTPVPSELNVPQTFLSFSGDPPLSADQLLRVLTGERTPELSASSPAAPSAGRSSTAQVGSASTDAPSTRTTAGPRKAAPAGASQAVLERSTGAPARLAAVKEPTRPRPTARVGSASPPGTAELASVGRASRTESSAASSDDAVSVKGFSVGPSGASRRSSRWPLRWVVLKPLSPSQASFEQRAADLMKRMVAAKIGGADAIFAWHVFDPEFGLLNADCSPRPLFLPWRTTAVALQGSQYLGSLQLDGGSVNHIFARNGQAAMILWNDQPTTERLYLGERVQSQDIWGRRHTLSVDGRGRQQIPVGPIPTILLGCSEPIARWRLAVRFEKGRVRSEYGGHEDALLIENTFPQGVSGTVSLSLPRDWEAEPQSWPISLARGEKVRLPFILTLPSDASLGTEQLYVDFDITADRRYRFRVRQSYQVGLGDIILEVHDRKLKDGRLEIEQVIINRTDPPEVLDFRCHLFIPGRKRQKLYVTKLGRDKDKKYYYVPNADELRGKELRLRAEQINGRRVLNKRWIVGQSWGSSSSNPERGTGAGP